MNVSMQEPEFPIEKITDEKLKNLALTGSNEKTVVLIQLNLPKSKFRVRKGAGQHASSAIIGLEKETPNETNEISFTTKKAKSFLVEILEAKPRWLSVPKVFIATANGKELQKIASSPFVKIIHPNRDLSI